MLAAESSQAASSGVQRVAQTLLRQLQGSQDVDEVPSTPSTTETVNSAAAAQEVTDEAAAELSQKNSAGAWQSAAENLPVHAVILQHMCQQTRSHGSSPTASSSQPGTATSTHHPNTGPCSDSGPLPHSKGHAHTQTMVLSERSNSFRQPRASACPGIANAATSSGCTLHNDKDRTALHADASTPAALCGTPDVLATPADDLYQGTSTRIESATFSDVRSAAHQRLASQGACQPKRGVRQQHDSAAFEAVLQAAPAVLQDMAVNIAEAVAACYLAEARSSREGTAV